MSTWIVQRKMVDNEVPILISVHDWSAGHKGGYVGGTLGGSYCGTVDGKQYPPCPDVTTFLDLDPKPACTWYGTYLDPAISLELDVSTGKITGDVTGEVGKKIVVQGDHNPRGKIELTITVEK